MTWGELKVMIAARDSSIPDESEVRFANYREARYWYPIDGLEYNKENGTANFTSEIL